jgi:peptidyl-tRNA hydrolase
MQDLDRLYIVVRADLPPGLMAAQAVHAAFHFSQSYPDMVTRWLNASNYLVIVSVSDEEALHDVISKARGRGIVAFGVREPDLDEQLTAVALQPGQIARRLCSSMPSALRRPAMI